MILRVLAIPSGQTVVGLLVLSALTGITAIAGRDGVGSCIILALAIVVRGSVADQNQILAVGVHLGVGVQHGLAGQQSGIQVRAATDILL